MTKARANKLDPFAARLEEWQREGKTLAQMQSALKEDGCVSALSSIGDYLARRRQEREERDLIERVATGAEMNRKLDAAYKENPAPDVEQLMRVNKTLIMSLQVQGQANPKLLSLANAMQQTWLNYLTGQTKASIETRKLALSEKKFQRETCHLFIIWSANEQAKAIAAGSADNSTKIEQLGRLMFGEDWEEPAR